MASWEPFSSVAQALLTSLTGYTSPKSTATTVTDSRDTFTLFPNLPYDIRELIWKAALRPHHLNRQRAIHRIKFTNRDDHVVLEGPVIFSLNRPFYKYRAESFHQYGNRPRSAYLYDAGMWTACKESRRIMAKYNGVLLTDNDPLPPCILDEKHWNDPPGRPDNIIHGASLRRPAECKACVMTARGASLEQSFQLHVYPIKDVFLIDASDWKMAMHYNAVLFYYPFSAMLGAFRAPPELAFDYHNSWTEEVPRDKTELFEEPSARGCMLRILRAVVRREISCQMWLIDRVARLKDGSIPGNPVAEFFDCDREYVRSTMWRMHINRHDCYSSVPRFVEIIYDILPRAMRGPEKCFKGVMVYKRKEGSA